MTDYAPIDCGLHSTYELAIMQQRILELSWQDADHGVQTGAVTPLDLFARNGEEYMRVREANGNEQLIRLDWIITCTIL
jgi:transcriptional antiterminator Rof (Rho-off)